ncbi:MAG TPA: Gfo/Idh/MocA family oxidoreductase [Candidatus Acidoferrales bacterium]|nr:Gfo/Idh/MocA family oxidoreductase [Candidatus Acidoferrales bacterium]
MKNLPLILVGLMAFGFVQVKAGETNQPPVHLAIYGLVHDHVKGFLPNALKCPDVQLVGIVEPNHDLALRIAASFHLDTNLFHATLGELLANTNVDAVATFTSTYDHRRVVEECVPLGLTVMMEKPLAVNLKDGRAIAATAKKYGIPIIVNYETTWYPGNQAAYDLVCEQHAIGDIRKIEVNDGHWGPKEIGCSQDFLAWLTDPKLDGGGALMDFGCYGADLMTWLMQGERPSSVFAVTQHFKPEVYPKVEDEATIVVTYPKAQGIIQASWNWPYNRKDMEIYGTHGYVLVPQSNILRVMKNNAAETQSTVAPLTGTQADYLSYLVAVVRKEIQPSGLSSLGMNLTVMEILDAARVSAKTGKRIYLPAR